jgi:murein L,D-transpeptidase YcbB/YkuD
MTGMQHHAIPRIQSVMLLWLQALLCACLLLLAGAVAAQPTAASVQQLLIDKVARLEAGETVTVADVEIASRVLLPAVYRADDYAPLWNDPRSVQQLLEAVRTSKLDGLDPEDYQLQTLEGLLRRKQDIVEDNELAADLDLLLTDCLIRLAFHLSFGKVDPEVLDPDWNMTRHAGDMEVLVQHADAIRNGQVDRLIASLRPQAPVYERLRMALAKYRELQAGGGWPSMPPGETLKPGMSGERVATLRQRLIITSDMQADPGDPASFDEALEAGVRTFQKRHGLEEDGLVGRSTLAALNIPVEQRIDQIRANLERARWVLHDLPQTYILVDIAGFRVSYTRNGEILWEARAVVGKPFRKSPVFRSLMTYLEVNPTWTVPPTILRQDVLPAIQSDPGYLAQKNMQVINYDGKPVDVEKVDWQSYTGRNFPYLIRQRPGPNNALGRIKFMFPNKHAVYLHDTPSKALFERTTRAFSSGCIRIENPFDLAGLLLEDDPDWDRQRLLEAVDARQTRRIPLRQPVNIILLYWTVTPTPSGEVIFKPDIYDRDPAIIRGLNAGFRFRDRAIRGNRLQGSIAPPDPGTNSLQGQPLRQVASVGQ